MNSKCKTFLLRLVITALVGIFALLCIFPFIWMVSASFKNEIDVMEFPIRIIPKVVNWNNYPTVWFKSDFPLYYKNSLIVTSVTLIGTMILSTTAAYGFARLKFRGKNIIFAVYLATLMVPVQVVLLPKYIYFGQLHLNNTFYALILPGIFSAFNTFLMRQYFEGIPYELTEAAQLDGANHFRTFFQVILPLTKSGLVTLLLFSFSWTWNDYINPLIYCNKESLLTLTVGLQRFQQAQSTHYALIMAGCTLALAPLIILFLFTQKYFIESFASSGVKG
ncbi:carbohydrate ABC transporter permease [Anaerocolumna aminovalerica]|jgi:multiple sugar transport system permease protein|uniref:Multiple sugar transport system permease protein n=2 Tax=Anaerocolumna aminovalerica TaxID=1527 RepID=A0A1I5GKD2_9FIRM|nr:carbohydrate ABC transporter permease [Anaerocolumna aminovalerica]MBU5333323.1 carbohydrate ABC transporter permease [Anaerocolumna aminovalerica]SFO36445.1 multiple sugar transport system permease protein [Anaerocolumna aminovalerica]